MAAVHLLVVLAAAAATTTTTAAVAVGGPSGASSSATSTVTGTAPLIEQKFAMQPQDQTAVVGSRVTLPCRVINKSGVLQWTKDDFGLGTHRNLSGFERYSMVGSDEEGDYSLDIYPVMLDDDARYQCQVAPGPRGEPGIRSHFAVVSVLVPPEPPKIVQGDYLVTTEDREIELECVSYGGKPAAEITWIDGAGNVLTDGLESIVEPLPDTRRFTAKSILKLTPKKEHHNTTFTCQAQNTAERTHRSARLRLEVKYAPKVTVSVLSGASPTTGRIPEGAEVRLACRADANPPDLTYKWYINDDLVLGDYTTELVIHNVSRRHHDAIVKCEVHNPVGKSEESETLDISYGPQFRTKPKSVQADVGASVTLTCDVDGNPPPDITWLHEPSERVVGSNPNFTVRVDSDTAGRYYCKAAVMGFPEVGADATIYVKGPPSIVSHRTQFGIEGDNVRVECTAFSVPAPDRVLWTFNGRAVSQHEQDYTILEDALPEGVKSTLIIRESQERHFGTYNCTVSNPYGSDMVEIVLMPQKNFPLLLVIIGVVGTVVVLVIVAMIVFLCQRQGGKKGSGNESGTMEKQCKESDRSSNISDLKLELRTGSSVSNVHCDMDFLPGADSETGSESVITRIGVPLAGPVALPPPPPPDVYRYSADYGDTSFPPKDGHNNNGYVPYVDYSRDYQPPAAVGGPGSPALPLADLSDIHVTQSALPNGTAGGGGVGVGVGVTMSGGGLTNDARFSAAYGNPYLRAASAVGLPVAHTAIPAATPAPPPYSRSAQQPPAPAPITTAAAAAAAAAVAAANGAVPQVARLPNSPTSQYIVPNAANLATIKRGTLATHV